jgi:small subunit ribosomal protein S18
MAEKRKYTKKTCKYCEMKVDFIDYKDIRLIRHSLSERYKIMPRRLTGNCKKHQELVERAIKRARHISLVPYIVNTKKVMEFSTFARY